MDFDALLILSFGGPEGPDDVMPFLRNVTRGRNVPDERLAVVAEQYAAFGGRSPINDHNRALKTALEAEFEQHGHEIPVYWGNRNWEPYVTDTVAQMAADGVRHALVYATSAFGSYSGCRQYREDLTIAIESLEVSAPTLDKLRLFYNHPGFLQPVADRVREAVASHHQSDQTHPQQTGSNHPATNQRAEPRHAIVFTAHSLPQSMAAACDYEEQLNEAAGLVMELLGDDAQAERWQVVYQSRSGPPHIPWLEPDVGDHLEQLRSEGIDRVTVVPLGFVSDHMEVLFDLDTQAAQRAEAVGLEFRRAATVGHDQQFLTMIRQLVEERIQEGPRLYLGQSGPWPDMCPEGHCLAASGRPT